MIDVVEQGAEKVGGVVELGRRLGINYRSMHSWKEVPPKRVLAMEAATGISRHIIRPDIYGPEPSPSEVRQ